MRAWSTAGVIESAPDRMPVRQFKKHKKYKYKKDIPQNSGILLNSFRRALWESLESLEDKRMHLSLIKMLREALLRSLFFMDKQFQLSYVFFLFIEHIYMNDDGIDR